MATSVVFNGVTYFVPAFGDTGYAQGPGNMSAYWIALASGSFQQTGGTFTLTAQANFGPNFGLTAVNFISTSLTPATVGTIRLANTDHIDWRNFGNTANLPLGVNVSDQLTFNGAIVSTTTANGTVNTGTANTLAYYPASTNTVDDLPAITALRALESNASGLPVASVTTATELSYLNGVTSALQTQLDGTVKTTGAQTIAGAKTFTDPITQNDTSNQLILGITNTTTINANAPAASRIVTIPDAGADALFVLSEGNQTINGIKTFAGHLIGKGTATNDNAAAGFIGEYIEAIVSSPTNYPATGVYGDLTSISLTAGDWDIVASVDASAAGALVPTQNMGIGLTANNNGPVADTTMNNLGPTSTTNTSQFGSYLRASIAGTTTYYLKYRATFTVATPQATGKISARRVR